MANRLYGSIHGGAKLLDDDEVERLEALKLSEDEEEVDSSDSKKKKQENQ